MPTFVRNFMSLRKPSLVLAPNSRGFPWVKLELMLTLLIPTPRLGTKQPSYNDTKKTKFSSYIRKFRWDQAQSHI